MFLFLFLLPYFASINKSNVCRFFSLKKIAIFLYPTSNDDVQINDKK